MTKLKRVGVFSLANAMGAGGLLVGLLFAGFYGLILLLAGSGSGAAPEAKVLGIGIGGLFLALIPFLYGIGGWITGVFYGLCTNLVLAVSGGLVIELEQSA